MTICTVVNDLGAMLSIRINNPEGILISELMHVHDSLPIVGEAGVRDHAGTVAEPPLPGSVEAYNVKLQAAPAAPRAKCQEIIVCGPIGNAVSIGD